MKNGINVLSLFDGMSCGRIALERAGVKVNKYFASEIDKYATQVSEVNYPDIVRIGDVTKVKGYNTPSIHLLIGGSPCQSFSTAGTHTGFDGKSALFFEYVRLLKEVNPKYFLLENVVMKKEWENVISDLLGVKPIKINSKLVSAQSRPRLYWTNIPNIEQPEDRGILLGDILESQADRKYAISDSKIDRILNTKRGKGFFYDKNNPKTSTLIAGYYKLPTDGIYVDLGFKRKLTPLECERLQTVPDNYTAHVSNSQRYKMLGNGWTVDVIAHIFKSLK